MHGAQSAVHAVQSVVEVGCTHGCMEGGLAAHLEAHDVCVVVEQLLEQILLPVAPGQHPGLAVAELLRLCKCPQQTCFMTL